MMRLPILTLFILAGTVAPSLVHAQPEVRRLYQEASEALRNGDAATYLKRFEQALPFRENHPLVMLRIAEGHALTGDIDEALDWLNRIAALGISMPLREDVRLNSLFENPGFREVEARMKRHEEPIVASSTALTLPLKGWIFEDVVRDPESGDFFLSSVRHRQVLRVSPGGEWRNIATAKDGLLAVAGLALDTKTRTLYTVSAPQPHMDDFANDGKRRAELIAIPLDEGKAIRRISLPEELEAPSPGDLALDSEGNVYISDGQNPVIYRWQKGEAEAKLWLRDERFSALQGLVLFEDPELLIVADYSRSLWRIDLRDKTVAMIKPIAGVSLAGIDGLARDGDSLIATQNGINPARVLRIRLDQSKSKVESVTVLEKNNPTWDEPTLGSIHNGAFYYISNSQWNRFDGNGKVSDENALRDLTVLRLPLH